MRTPLVTAPEVTPVVGTSHWCGVCPRNRNLGHGSHRFRPESLNVEHEGIPDKTWTAVDLGHSIFFKGKESHYNKFAGLAQLLIRFWVSYLFRDSEAFELRM